MEKDLCYLITSLLSYIYELKNDYAKRGEDVVLILSPPWGFVHVTHGQNAITPGLVQWHSWTVRSMYDGAVAGTSWDDSPANTAEPKF